MKLDLRDGQWAELRDRITHGQDKDIKAAIARGKTENASTWDWGDVIIRAFVKEWRVSDVDDVPIALADGDALDRAPDDIVDALLVAVSAIYKQATVPNSPTPPSSADTSSGPE